MKTKLSESEAEAEEPKIKRRGIERCDWFILSLLLPTPTNQFSLDRKQQSQKQNRCSASDSVGFIFTRSYRSTLLNMTPTTTPSLVKASLKGTTERENNRRLERKSQIIGHLKYYCLVQ